MKRTLRMFALACTLLVLSAPRTAAQTGTIKADVLKDWTDMKATIVKIAQEMPEDRYTFRSTAPQRDFAAQVLHIAQVNVRFLAMIGGKATAPAVAPGLTKKSDVITAMSDTFDYGTALINEQTDQTMLAAVNAGFMGQSTKARVFYFLIGHTWDIYGQMAVYLRLNGRVPPASQRP